MASKVDQLMRNYDKIKQFPMDGPLMPLTEEQAASTQDNLSTKRPLSDAVSSVSPQQAPLKQGETVEDRIWEARRRLKVRRMCKASVARSAKVQGSTKK